MTNNEWSSSSSSCSSSYLDAAAAAAAAVAAAGDGDDCDDRRRLVALVGVAALVGGEPSSLNDAASPSQPELSPSRPFPHAPLEQQQQQQGQRKAAQKRKLRVLVITMGGERQEHIRAMFHSCLSHGDFEEPVFSPGIPSRSLRNRLQFFRICHQVGLLPEQEWKAMEKHQVHFSTQDGSAADPKKFFDCLKDVPIESSEPAADGRRRRRRRVGNEADRKLHYSVELWRKAKTINRGRSVLACTLAHLLALKTFTTPNDSDDNDNGCKPFDVLLEDNVRVPVNQAFCADRIRQVLQASRDFSQQTDTPCHLRYYGWLGSLSNLRWIHESYLPKRTFSVSSSPSASVAPFPTAQDIESDLLEKKKKQQLQQQEGLDHVTNLMQMQSLDEKGDSTHDDNQQQQQQQQQTNGQQQQQQQQEERPPGGTPVWGAYAYWISRQAYEHVLHELQQDVGSLLWKGKRARYYSVKPIDKILPRKVKEHFGTTDAIHISTRPCFFRAPMLTSRIHAQWDASFCESTQYQLAHYCDKLKWPDLWLTTSERAIVDHYQEHGKWLTLSELEEMQQTAVAAATNSHTTGAARATDINSEKQNIR